MHKPQSITITVDKPCNQSWDEMTPEGRGRFCAACQKTVIDFTAWSDAALYQFFAKEPANVCGHFLSTQLNKPIRIPHQPQSRLYRLTIALGLTLICTQTPAALAQNRPPKVSHGSSGNTAPAAQPVSHGFGSIHGNIIDGRNGPIIAATVQVFKEGVLTGVSMTDYDGNYTIKPLSAGVYELIVSFPGYDSVIRKNVVVIADDSTKEDAVMIRIPAPVQKKRVLVDGGVSFTRERPELTRQALNAGIYGHVTDKHGIYLTGTEIQLYRDDSLLSRSHTDANGAYDISGLNPGSYELRFLTTGHKRKIVRQVQIFMKKTECNVTLPTQ